MEKREKYVLVVITIVIVVGALGTMLFAGLYTTNSYFIDKKIPGIVEGTAEIFDSQTYFAENDLTEASVQLNIECNNTSNLEIHIGYKTPNYDLLDTSIPTKDICLWNNKNLYPSNSISNLKTESQSIVKLDLKWNLFDIGFSNTEFVKADERIWYLKIKKMEGPYGYEKNTTEIINGTEITIPEYIPNVNSINQFELTFGDVTFKSLLHPYFDGSCDVTVAIRGVNHEIVFEDQKRSVELGLQQQSYTTTIPTGANDNWAIVFATENYQHIGFKDNIQFVWSGYMMIFGEYTGGSGLQYPHYNGLFDYGWNIMYCMDGSESNLPTKTCSKTDDNYLESMYDDANSYCGYWDQLLVFIHGHGYATNGKHFTLSTKTIWFFGYTNVIKADEHKSKISAITDDGTFVFLWLCSCHGESMGDWTASQHHYRLEVWYYDPVGYTMASAPSAQPTYDHAFWVWNDPDNQWTGFEDSEAHLFFLNCEQSNPKTVSAISYDIQEQFDEVSHPESNMYIYYKWGSFAYYI